MKKQDKREKKEVVNTPEFALPQGMKGAFGLIEPWESPKSAEHENIQRIVRAAAALSLRCVLISYDGYIVSEMRNGVFRRVTAEDVDFVISLHFHTPKAVGVHTYGCLWSPPQHYFDWGYDKSVRTLLTHDDYLHCGSQGSSSHLTRLLHSSRRSSIVPPVLPFYLSIAGPVIAPDPERLKKPKLFYCGINWEKIDGSKGRYHDLFKMLEANTALEIYGPDSFHGKNPWEGFSSYVGPIPMDGQSTVFRVAQCGVSLVLSSEAHVDAGLMTNRLYESLAAGALLIVNDNVFVREHFGDSVLYLSNTPDHDLLYEQIMNHLIWIRQHPEAALAKAAEAQHIFVERFRLDRVIGDIYQKHPERRAMVEQVVCARSEDETIDVVIPFLSRTSELLDRCVANLACQEYRNINAVLVVDEELMRQEGLAIRAKIGRLKSVSVLTMPIYQQAQDWRSQAVRKLRSGQLFQEATEHFKGRYFSIMNPAEEWFPNHLTTLKRVLEDDGSAAAAYSGVLSEYASGEAKTGRRLDYILQEDQTAFVFATQTKHGGSFLFRRHATRRYDAEVLSVLDGCEHTLFVLDAFVRGGIQATELVTMVTSEKTISKAPVPLTSLPDQCQFIRDLFYFNQEYLNERATLVRPRKFVYAFDTGAPISSKTTRSPSSGLSALAPGEVIRFGQQGNAICFQTHGWSGAESGFTWMEGGAAGLAIDYRANGDDFWVNLRLAPMLIDEYQRLSVSVNDVMLGTYRFISGDCHELAFLVPGDLHKDGEALVLKFEAARFGSPGSETRRLAFQFFECWMVPWPNVAATASIRARLFDEKYYISSNPDVALALRDQIFRSGFEHYVRHGKNEGREARWIEEDSKSAAMNPVD